MCTHFHYTKRKNNAGGIKKKRREKHDKRRKWIHKENMAVISSTAMSVRECNPQSLGEIFKIADINGRKY